MSQLFRMSDVEDEPVEDESESVTENSIAVRPMMLLYVARLNYPHGRVNRSHSTLTESRP